MAIKNTALGGTDWTEEILTPTDLNDTIDEAGKAIINEDPYWTLLETITFSSDNTKTSGTLAAYDQYMLRFDLIRDASGTSKQYLSLYLNAVEGTSYQTLTLSTSGFTYNASDPAFRLPVMAQNARATGECIFDGASSSASNAISMYSNVLAGLAAHGIAGVMNIGGTSTAVTSLTVESSLVDNVFTGSVKIYGRNF